MTKMIFIAAFLACLLIALRLTGPRRYSVHASTARALPAGIASQEVYVGADFLRDESGKHFDVSGKFVGVAVRNSMAAFGIPDGATFVGNYLHPEHCEHFDKGDIVVVDGESEHSETGLRLRVIDHIDGSLAYFCADGFGQNRRPRPITEIIAKVTHVVDSSKPQEGFTLRLLRKLFSFSKAA